MTPIEEMVGALQGVMRESSLSVAAQHHARQLANTHLPDALPIIIDLVEKSVQPQSSASSQGEH
jgi:hypothetical protein